jgi:NADH-quinone oxidoreductase subunit J
MWLMLPRGERRGWPVGALLGVFALVLWMSQVPRLGDWFGDAVFLVLAGITVVSAAAAVTLANPVYSAIWFGMSLMGTAGLFLYQGAQFLALATMVIYAGAILVTFLFVLMLAQPQGKAYYDRMSWEAMVSAATGAVFVGILSASFYNAIIGVGKAVATAEELQQNVLSPQHVEHLGKEIFGRNLLAVEVTGVLLLVALVGAAAIVLRSKMRPKEEVIGD